MKKIVPAANFFHEDFGNTSVTAAQETGTHQVIQEREDGGDCGGYIGQECCIQNAAGSGTFARTDNS